MNAKISIIVPVFNLEKLLPRCVDSILEQHYKNIELILVNDASTDGSLRICQDYADRDERVLVIDKENGGVASARNAGLDMATGDYIGFVDNDDYIHPKMFETLYETTISHDADIVVCDFLKVEEEERYGYPFITTEYKTEHFNQIEACHQLFTENRVTFVCPWNKLYKRYLFDEIRYEEGSMNDDETIAHELYYSSKKITYIQIPFYYYVQRKGSQTGSFTVKRLDAVYALKRREIFFKKMKEKDLHQKAVLLYAEKFFWYYDLAKTSNQQLERELKDLKRTFNKTLYALLTHNQIGWRQKIMFILFYIHPAFFERVRDKHKKQQAKAL